MDENTEESVRSQQRTSDVDERAMERVLDRETSGDFDDAGDLG